MSYLDDPRVLLAAERNLLAWQCSAIALIAFGFVVERKERLVGRQKTLTQCKSLIAR